MNSVKTCIICQAQLRGDYLHRGQCGHHQCLLCALPMLRAGKGYCTRCPAPTRPHNGEHGNLVLGYDGEQNLRVAAELLTERQKVCPAGKSRVAITTEPFVSLYSVAVGSPPPSEKLGVCAGGSGECLGGEMCLHDCYRELTRDAMRERVQYRGAGAVPVNAVGWRERARRLIDMLIHPVYLRQCGISAELLAFCGISIDDLVLPRSNTIKQKSHYYLEHLIDGLRLTYDDLLLLGFSVQHLRDKRHYPLIALYKQCAFGAKELFDFHLSPYDLEHCVLNVDARYAPLLNLNLPYWLSALQQGT